MRRSHGILVAALIAALAAGSASAGTAQQGPATGRNCGTISAGGASWLVLAINVPCARAKTLVQPLAAKPPRGPSATARYPSRPLGMTCVHHPRLGGKRVVYCLATTPYRSVSAILGAKRP